MCIKQRCSTQPCSSTVFPSTTCSTSPYDPSTQFYALLHTQGSVCVSCPVGKQSSSSHTPAHAAVTVTQRDTSGFKMFSALIMARLHPYISPSLSAPTCFYILCVSMSLASTSSLPMWLSFFHSHSPHSAVKLPLFVVCSFWCLNLDCFQRYEPRLCLLSLTISSESHI